MTFSIVAWDPAVSSGPEWGVAVASKFLAVGSVVPYARASVGAIATQALANPTYGPEGLRRLGEGEDAATVLAALTGADEGRPQRQLGLVDGAGGGASFTGEDCLDWAGGTAGVGYACQGNILAGPEVIDRMVETFDSTVGDLATRLVASLRAGDEAGGDRRGRQSAAVLVVRSGGGYLGGSDVAVDLRVDDHLFPVEELERLLGIHRFLFPRPEDLEPMPIDPPLASELRALLVLAGLDPGTGTGYDDGLRDSLAEWMGVANLELRWLDGPALDRTVLAELRRSAAR